MAPSCAPSPPTTTEANQQEAVALCLQRLRPGHFQAKRLAFEIRDVGFTPAGSLGTLQLLVRWIFDRAMTEPERFAAPCASLCFSLTPILPTFKPPGALTAAAKAKRIDFRQTLLNLCQREFEAACTTAFLGDALPEDAVKPNDSSLSGSLQFLACLYLHHLLTDRIMLSCLAVVASGSLGGGSGATTSSGEGGGERPLLSGSNVPQRIECLVRALLIAGRQLDECLPEQYRPVLDGLYDQLAAHKAQAVPELAPDVQTALAQLLEFRAGRWANGGGVVPGLGLAPPAAGAAAAARAHANGVSSRAPNGCAASTATSSDAAGSPKAGKGIVVTTVYRSSGRLVVTAPGSAAAAVPGTAAAAAARLSSSPGATHGSATAGPEAAGVSGPSTAASALLSRRQQQLGGSSRSSGSMQLSRPASVNQNLEGLWELSQETYSDVRTQLLAQPVENSPATLEAMADELVESAIAASGGDANCPCWGAPARPELRPLSPAVAAGQVASAAPVQQQPQQRQPPPLLSDEEWAELVQQQWEAQCAACDIYVRLCVDALQQMSMATPSAAGGVLSPPPPTAAAASGASGARTSGSGAGGCNGAAEPSAAAADNGPAAPPAAASLGGTVGDTGRAFRRLLLSSAQTHFERCLAALLPVPPSPSHCAQPNQPMAASTPDGVGGAAAAAAPRRAWGDMPAVAPDAASALPRARGVCQLLLGLLRYGLLTPRIVLHCAAALVDGAAGGSAGCLQCACILLAGAGKQAPTFKVSEAAAFESLVKRLQGLAEAEKTAGYGTVGTGAAGSSKESRNGNDSGNGNSSCGSSYVSGNANGSGGDPSDAEDAAARELRRRFVSWLVAGLRAR